MRTAPKWELLWWRRDRPPTNDGFRSLTGFDRWQIPLTEQKQDSVLPLQGVVFALELRGC